MFFTRTIRTVLILLALVYCIKTDRSCHETNFVKNKFCQKELSKKILKNISKSWKYALRLVCCSQFILKQGFLYLLSILPIHCVSFSIQFSFELITICLFFAPLKIIWEEILLNHRSVNIFILFPNYLKLKPKLTIKIKKK